MITVISNHAVTQFTPLESSYTVSEPTSPMNGQTYRRIWQEGGNWTAYLGRAGVKFRVTGQAWPAVQSIEVQAKSPAGQWSQLASQGAESATTNADTTVSVMLGTTVPGRPLVPSSFQDGNPQTGQWLFRARIQDSNSGWSDFSPEVPVEVVLPVVSKTVSGQTVPPAGPLGAWFTASPVQTYSFQFWIP